jgi:hypothetical protein
MVIKKNEFHGMAIPSAPEVLHCNSEAMGEKMTS